jgi:hypothetical protein
MIALLLLLGCSQTTPTTPGCATLPTFVISLDNIDRSVDMGLLMDDRSAQAVVWGTNMTAAQLRQYFAVNIVNDPSYGWPAWAKCPIYKIMMNTFKQQSDATVFSWVVTMETNGYDVPNAPPPKAIC